MSKGNANNTNSNIKFPGHHNLITNHSNGQGGATATNQNGGSSQSQAFTGAAAAVGTVAASSTSSASQPSTGLLGNPTKGPHHPINRLQSSSNPQLSVKHPTNQVQVNGSGQYPHQKAGHKLPQQQQQHQQQYHLNQYQLESQQRQHQQHHQKLLEKNLLPANTNLLPPPRYQPPPQPQQQNQQQQQQQVNGILKNIAQNPDDCGSESLKLKQPQEVEELSNNFYLTGSKSLSNISSRIVPPKKQLLRTSTCAQEQTNNGTGHTSDIQVQIHPPPRISAQKTPPPPHPSNKAVEDELNFLQRQQQQFQQQEMLKFVRKSDSGQPSPSSSGGGSASGRIPTDQSRHLQVLLFMAPWETGKLIVSHILCRI